VRQSVIDGVSSGLSAIFILLAVGAPIGAWAISGAIVTMIYYGLMLMSPQFFYISTTAICALVGLAIGSSWTVVGTIGVGLMGVAATLGLSPEITAGAIVSGAYSGDKSSPLSDTVNLVTAVTGLELFRHIRESLWPSIPALLLSLLLFHLLGPSGPNAADAAMANLTRHFNVSLWAFAPLVFVFALAVLRAPPFRHNLLGRPSRLRRRGFPQPGHGRRRRRRRDARRAAGLQTQRVQAHRHARRQNRPELLGDDLPHRRCGELAMNPNRP
jgi:NhaC family Na+:H+ antiporter